MFAVATVVALSAWAENLRVMMMRMTIIMRKMRVMMRMMMTMSSHSNLPILPLEEESLSFLLLPDKETPRFLSSFSS